MEVFDFIDIQRPFSEALWFLEEGLEHMDKEKKWKNIIELDGFIIQENDENTRALDENGNIIVEHPKRLNSKQIE